MAEPVPLDIPGAPPKATALLRRRVGGRPRLLLIDDDTTVARFLGHAAEECGYEALVTITAESFRAQYLTANPAVVVIDLALPGSDGVELLRFLAEHRCEALVLIISGFDVRVLDAAVRLGTEMGLHMAGPLGKPVRFQALMEAIGEADKKATAL